MESIDKSLLKVLQKKASGTMAIFERNEFYSCYEDDALLVANEIFLSEVGLRKVNIGLSELSYHNLNNGQYARVVRDVLLILHYRLEVYSANDGEWTLKAKGSLGCLGDFEDMVGDSVELSELSTVMAVLCSEKPGSDEDENEVAVAFCNLRDMRMTIAEFVDTQHFTNLEKCIVSMVPRECVILPYETTSVHDKTRMDKRIETLQTTLRRADVMFTQFPDMSASQEIDIEKLLNVKSKEMHKSTRQRQCLSVLVSHLHVTDDPLYEEHFQLVDYKSTGFTYLDMAALKALELFTMSNDEESACGQTGTLFELLNKCRTPQGQRLLREWIRRPLSDLRRINERLDVVEALTESTICRVTFHDDLLRRVPDVLSLSRKLLHKRASLQHCYRLYQLIRLLKRFEEVIFELHDSSGKFKSSINDLILEPMRLAVLEFANFATLIETTVDVDHLEETGNYRIKPSIDDSLLETARGMEHIEKKCQNELNKVSANFKEVTKLDSNSQHGFFFRVSLKAEKSIRQAGLTILEMTKGGGVRFISKKLEALNAEYKELMKRYEAGQAELVMKVVETCAGYTPALHDLCDCLAIVDVVVSLATLTATSPSPYVRPELLDKGCKRMVLKGCRHPVIEALPYGPAFIPNDVIMGVEPEEESRFLLLTGANMGGKSTYLRSCALTVLMAQMGCFVACQSASLSLVDGIHTRVGSCDYQCKGVSTFMAEMIDSASILEGATSDSLVLVDELGRGTSTYDGFGLAWAIADEILTRIGCFCVFATHFHEMIDLHNRHPNHLSNIRVETLINEDGDMVLLYKVLPGVAERSFGLNIAKLVGIPSDIIQTASDMLDKLGEGRFKTETERQLMETLKGIEGEQLREAILALPSDE